MQRHTAMAAITAGALLTAPALAQDADPYAQPYDSVITLSDASRGEK
jgi:hypothetical protein